MTAPSQGLVAERVTVRFGGLTAVSKVSLWIRPGEMVGLIGPNGAGKTTFFNILSGTIAPTSGTLRIDGREFAGRRPDHFARAGIARTFQTPRVFGPMTVAENVRFGRAFAGRRPDHNPQVPGDVDDLLAFVGLRDEAEVEAAAITPARQRLLEIAMALSTRPRLLLLDEVAAGLTEAEVQRMAELIRRCRDELGLAVVWIEHAVAVIMRAVERVIVLHHGELIADGPPGEVVRDATVVEAYLGTPMEVAP